MRNSKFSSSSSSYGGRLLPFLIVIFSLIGTHQCYAATYTFQSTSYVWETAANNVVWEQACTSYPRDDDKAVVPIGFTFNFSDIDYTQVRIHSNGALQFGTDTGFHRQYINSDLPITSLPARQGGCARSQADRVMLVYWDDINPRLGGTVRYETKGIAPNRRLVVSWENVPHYNYGGSYTFQVILYENGEFIYQYGVGNASGVSASIGVEVDNNDFTLYSYNSSYSYSGTALKWFRPSGAPSRLAEYWLEAGAWDGTPNEVMDWSGNNYHGVSVGSAQTTEFGYVCRGGVIPANTRTRTIDAINTNLDVDATIGNSGTITFWYKSNRIWSGGDSRDHQLLDATTQANRWFFLTKRASGQLRFVVSDSIGTSAIAETSAQSVAAGQWKHIAVSWRVEAGSNQTILRIYVDGVFSAVTQRTTNGSLSSSLGTLYVGDNRSGAVGERGTGNSADGAMDEVRVYNYEISNADVVTDMNLTHPCIFVHHIRILHDGEGLTCASEALTLQACIDATCSATYNGNVTVDLTSPASGWFADPVTFSGGSQVVNLRVTAPSVQTLNASSVSPAAVGPTRCFAGAIESCQITFFETGFIYDVPDLTACQTSSNISIQAVRTDAITQTCIADSGFASANKTVNFWSTYVNPATGTEQVSLSGTGIATASSGTGIPLNFDANATANFTVTYPDAGQMQLNARYDGVVGTEGDGLVMLGNDSFIARPVGLCVYSDDASADCAAGNGSCSVFKRVDEAFNLKVKGVCWESSGDTDYCSGNPTTPNFQLNSIPISHNLVAPSTAGVSSGNIGVSSIDILAADSGEHIISNQIVSEVGVYTFTATPPNYFGGMLPAATSVNIGRFTPDHFLTSITTDGVLQDSCTGFTYSGQTFSYEPSSFPQMSITAAGSTGNTTINYRDDFVKLDAPATQIVMPAVTSDASNLGADSATLLNLTWTTAASTLSANDDGTLDFSLGADQFVYAQDANALVAPFTSDIQLRVNSVTDSDGIVATDLPQSFIPAGTEIRYGQLLLQNAYGPETLPLTISVLSEYYDGTAFVLNTLDNCTPYDFLNLSQDSYQGNLISGDTTASGSDTLLSGIGNSLSLSAPGVGHDGSVDLSYDLDAAGLSWLKPGGNNPTAKATFGIFKGNQRLIYMRESVW